ncbi:MAG: trypsin-like serine protease [Deltaproteobacteria bacterium]|nr:trypsin-like serine protease [Deltaproteobacteria bacterium]
MGLILCKVRTAAIACTLVLAIALTAALAPGAVSASIVNGTATFDYPEVGMLLHGSNPWNSGMTCSGTLIACRSFLTAAHCVCPWDGEQCQGAGAPYKGLYSVYLQGAGVYRAESVRVNPGYSYPAGDLAVVTLDRPVEGIVPAAMAGVTPAVGSAVVVVGYGRSDGAASDFGIKRMGDVTTVGCESGDDNGNVCWNFDGSASNTCHGDSGGPLFVDQGDGPRLAGVTSGGTQLDCGPGDHSFDTSVAAWTDWVNSVVDEAAGCEGAEQQAALIFDASANVGFADALADKKDQDQHRFTVPAGSSAVAATLNSIDDSRSDLDLYLRAGSPATEDDFDCRSIGGGPFGHCSVAEPLAGDWYAMVASAKGAAEYQLLAVSLPSPASSCGDGLREYGEECDQADDQACPGQCDSSCACPHACSANLFQVRKLESRGGRLVLKGRLLDYFGDFTSADPRLDLSLAELGAPQGLGLFIPSGDPGWDRSRPGRGRYSWKGSAYGLPARLKLMDRGRRKAIWKISARLSLDGGDVVPAASLRLAFGGLCAVSYGSR